jgi:hypothetical protein
MADHSSSRGASIMFAASVGPELENGAVYTKPALPSASKLGEVNIPLAHLDPFVQEKLKAFDVDGDGFISMAEILRHGGELEQSRQKARRGGHALLAVGS